eukprot:973158-Rhodomonas_salina.2
MSGTEAAYGANRLRNPDGKLPVNSLDQLYTQVSYDPMRRRLVFAVQTELYAVVLRVVGCMASGARFLLETIVQRWSTPLSAYAYSMPGTDFPFNATVLVWLSAYAGAMRWPVPTYRMVLPGPWNTGLCPGWNMRCLEPLDPRP